MAKKTKIDEARYGKQSKKRGLRVIRCSVLIVCEGEKTEPSYFKAFSHKNQGIFVYDIKLEGAGRGTKQVVDKAIGLKKKYDYDRVWAVFDKDDFPDGDFNAAITMGNNNGVCVTWSNEAFELWYLYHFHNVTTRVQRAQYGDMISRAVNASPKYKSKVKYVYAKNAPNNFEIMTTYGSMDDAIQYAETAHLQYSNNDYANQNPCTTVYKLVRQLLGRDEELNKELSRKVEADMPQGWLQ